MLRALSFIYYQHYITSVGKGVVIQSGAEPTDTFQMVIDNIWKQGKISETVYKYVKVCYLLSTDYFPNIRQMASVYINALLQACLDVAVHAPP